MLIDVVWISKAAQVGPPSRADNSRTDTSFAETLAASTGNAAPRMLEASSASGNSPAQDAPQTPSGSNRPPDTRGTVNAAADDRPKSEFAAKSAVATVAADVKATARTKLKDRLAAASPDGSTPTNPSAQKDTAPTFAKSNTVPVGQPIASPAIPGGILDSTVVADVFPPAVSWRSLPEPLGPAPEVGVTPADDLAATPPAGIRSCSAVQASSPDQPAPVQQIAPPLQVGSSSKALTTPPEELKSPQQSGDADQILTSFMLAKDADGESARTSEFASLAEISEEPVPHYKASAMQDEGAVISQRLVENPLTAADSSSASPQVSSNDPTSAEALPVSETGLLPVVASAAGLTGISSPGLVSTVRRDEASSQDMTARGIGPIGPGAIPDVSVKTSGTSGSTVRDGSRRSAPLDDTSLIPDLEAKKMSVNTLSPAESRIVFPVSSDGMQVDKPPHGAATAGPAILANDIGSAPHLVTSALSIMQDVASSPSVAPLVAPSPTFAVGTASGEVQAGVTTANSPSPAATDPKVPATLAPKDDDSNSLPQFTADRPKFSQSMGPVQSLFSTLAAPTTHDSTSVATSTFLSPASNEVSLSIATKNVSLPSPHQALDSAPVAASSDLTFASSVPHPSVDPDSLRMHLGVHTNAFGNVEIHTIIEQAQVGVAIHSDRDLARLFNAEVSGLETGLKSHHLDLAGVDFSSDRSGVQTSTGFQQGQPRQSFFQSSASQNTIPEMTEIEPASIQGPDLIAALPAKGPESHVSFLA